MLATSLMLYLDDVLDEEQVINIFSDLTRKNPPFPYRKFDRIEVQLEDMSEAEVKAEFRFAPSEIELLSQALRIPGTFTCSNGTVASGEEGLLMLLKRFAYPCRLTDMIPRFGRSAPEISFILAEVTDHISILKAIFFKISISPGYSRNTLRSLRGRFIRKAQP